MSDQMNTVGATMGAEIKAFRSAAVTSENKATPLARAILAALVAGLTSPEGVVSTVIHAFGNPKSPKTGKPVAKLSGLRDFVGGDATRKTVESIMTVHGNLDFDKPGDHNGNKGASAIRSLVVSFILDDAKAPKSLKALKDAVKDLIDAHVALTAPESDATDEERGEGPSDAAGDATPPATPMTLAERIASLIVAIDNASAEELLTEAVDDAIPALYASIKAAYERAVPADELEQSDVELKAAA